MKNKQLAVLLDNVLQRLIAAKEEVEIKSPNDLKSTGVTLLGEKYEYFDHTHPLEDLINSLQSEIDILIKRGNNNDK
jgi:hypothetical protein